MVKIALDVNLKSKQASPRWNKNIQDRESSYFIKLSKQTFTTNQNIIHGKYALFSTINIKKFWFYKRLEWPFGQLGSTLKTEIQWQKIDFNYFVIMR